MTKIGKSRRELLSARAEAVSSVNQALARLGKKMWRVSETDGLKLIKLLVWAERYSVSLEYILSAILGVLSKAVERRTGRRSKGLGVTVSVLVGEVAQSILLERIQKDYPSGENVSTEMEDRRNAMLDKLDSEANGKPRNPLAYHSARQFTQAYQRTILRKRKEREKLEEAIAAMPFRGNPFR